MSKLKVYISSTYLDLKDFRLTLIDFFEKQGSRDFELSRIMERMYDEGNNETFLETCLREVDNCDIYIIILLHSAGSFPPSSSKLTYTQHEYQKAIERATENPNSIKIFRFVYTGFETGNCNSLENYNQLRQSFEGYPINKFDDIKDFRIKYLEAFFSLTDNNSNYIVKRSPAEIFTIIDRRSQIINYKLRSRKVTNEKVVFFYYQSKQSDYAHYLNYRLSLIGNSSPNLQFKSELFINISELISSSGNADSFKNLVINDISSKLFKNEGIYELDEFIKELEDYKNNQLIIPVLISHSSELRENRVEFNYLNDLFLEISKINIDKKIIFIINMQDINANFLNDFIIKNPFLKIENNLGDLKIITLDDVKTWIMENVNSNPVTANAYISKYFPGNFPKPMGTVLNQLYSSEEFFKNYS